VLVVHQVEDSYTIWEKSVGSHVACSVAEYGGQLVRFPGFPGWLRSIKPYRPIIPPWSNAILRAYTDVLELNPSVSNSKEGNII